MAKADIDINGGRRAYRAVHPGTQHLGDGALHRRVGPHTTADGHGTAADGPVLPLLKRFRDTCREGAFYYASEKRTTRTIFTLSEPLWYH